MFRTVPLSIIRSFSLYTHQWYMSHRFADSLRAGSRWKFYSKNKFWEISASSWFYYKNLSRCTITWTSNTSNLFTQNPFCSSFSFVRVIIRPNNDYDYCFYSSVWFECVSKLLDNRSVIENRRSEQERTNNVVYPQELCSTDKWPHIPENKRQTELVYNSVKGHLQCNT